jgi:rhomboid protease GluP
MAVCARCGRDFSSFSFGSNPPTECRACRQARKLELVTHPEPATSNQPAVPAPAAAPFRPTVTLAIIALNVLVYVAMGISGVSWTEPNINDAVRWGADFGPLTLSGEWWRLLTSTFIHFGIIHIGFNLYCLWDLGRALEYFMGRKAFAVTYLLSGLTASLVSVAWNPWRVSAGASGAIFGVAGSFLAYLAFKKTPYAGILLKQRIKSLAIFIAYNLFRGLAGGVDNSAHLGGLVAGFVLGAVIPAVMTYRLGPLGLTPEPSAPADSTSGREARANRVAWQTAVAGVALLLIAAFGVYRRGIAEVHYGRGVRAAQAGKTQTSIEEMNAATSGSGAVLAYASLGESYLEKGNPAAAIAPLQQALKLDSEWLEPRHNLALAYLGSGQSISAVQEILGVLHEEKPEDWRARFILGAASEASGDRRAASESFGSVIAAKPDMEDARLALASMQASPASRVSFPIPYSKLILKSEFWPLYP